jgi:hypothetical protein
MIPQEMTKHLAAKDQTIAENYVNNEKRKAKIDGINECIELLRKMHKEQSAKHNYYLNAVEQLKRLKKIAKGVC